MAEIVQDKKTGLLFETGNLEGLASKMKWMIENEDACIEMGRNARREFEAKYTAERNFEMLMGIYEKVVRRWEAGKMGGWGVNPRMHTDAGKMWSPIDSIR